MGEVVELSLKCPLCNGTGKIDAIVATVLEGTLGLLAEIDCAACEGTGKRAAWKVRADRAAAKRLSVESSHNGP